MKRTAIQPKGVAKPGGHYSHGIVVEDARRTLYVAGLERLGYLLATFVLVALVLRVIEGKRWAVAVPVAAASAAASYVVFAVWLGTRLPAGVVERLFG